MISIDYSLANQISNNKQMILLLSEGVCRNCDLRYLDLVHGDLKNVDITGSSLEGSNLNNAILDGSLLKDTDLTDTNFNGASLRNADFRGATMDGTDFRNADLTNAVFDEGALSASFWDNALGIDFDNLSYFELHNAGAENISRNFFSKAEYFFNLAANKNPTTPNTFLALTYTQIQLGKFDLALINLEKAAEIYTKENDKFMLENISNLKDQLIFEKPNQSPGIGIGSKVLSSLLSSFSIFAQPVFNIPNQFVISR